MPDTRGVVYTYLHELVCLACSRPLGEVSSDTRNPPRLMVPHGLRCDACGGTPTLNGDWTRHGQVTDPIEIPPTRIGRPPGRPPRAAYV